MDILHNGRMPVNFYHLEDAKGLVHLKQVGATRTACGKSINRISTGPVNVPKFPTCVQCVLRS